MRRMLNTLTLRLLQTSWSRLLVVFVGLYAVLGGAFVGLYLIIEAATGVPAIVPSYSADPATLADAIYFSFMTQATMVYGDLRPAGWARLAAGSQAFLGICFNAVLLGAVVYRLARRAPDVRLSKRLCYDLDEQGRCVFKFRYCNFDRDPLLNVRTFALVAMPASGDEADVRTIKLELEYDLIPMLPECHIYLAKTAPVEIPNLHDKKTFVQFEVIGSYATTGDAVYKRVRYSGAHELVRGQYRGLDQSKTWHLPYAERLRLIEACFDRVVPFVESEDTERAGGNGGDARMDAAARRSS